MRNRELLSKVQLDQWITDYVCKHSDCEGTRVTVQYRLRDPDSEGCNWSNDVIFSPGPNVDKSQVTAIIGNAIREARDKFNLKD